MRNSQSIVNLNLKQKYHTLHIRLQLDRFVLSVRCLGPGIYVLIRHILNKLARSSYVNVCQTRMFFLNKSYFPKLKLFKDLNLLPWFSLVLLNKTGIHTGTCKRKLVTHSEELPAENVCAKNELVK